MSLFVPNSKNSLDKFASVKPLMSLSEEFVEHVQIIVSTFSMNKNATVNSVSGLEMVSVFVLMIKFLVQSKIDV